MRLSSYLLGLGLCFLSANAFAWFDLQLSVGSRSATYTTTDATLTAGSTTVTKTGADSKTKGTDVTVGVHVEPLPLPMVTIGFGLYVSALDLTVSGDDAFENKLTGTDIGFDTLLGVSIPGVSVAPFIRFGYGLFGAVVGEGDNEFKSAYKLSGTHFAGGIKYSVVPFVGILLQFDIANQKLASDKITYQGATVDLPDATMTSNAIMLGVEAGI